VTKSKFDNKYGCPPLAHRRHQRATDVLIGGKVAVVSATGDVGKGCADRCVDRAPGSSSPRSTDLARSSAAMDGYQVATMEDVVATADISSRTTGCFDVIYRHDMAKMNTAIVGNIGHFDKRDRHGRLSKRSDVSGQHQAAGRRVGV